MAEQILIRIGIGEGPGLAAQEVWCLETIGAKGKAVGQLDWFTGWRMEIRAPRQGGNHGNGINRGGGGDNEIWRNAA